jgi:hypothetical protein
MPERTQSRIRAFQWRRGRYTKPRRPRRARCAIRACSQHRPAWTLEEDRDTGPYTVPYFPAAMADPEDIKARIVSSVFDRRRAKTGIEELYVGHLKIWEETEDGSDKPRYVLLSRSCRHIMAEAYADTLHVPGTNDGQGFIHKAKLNENGTFGVGKTWPVAELRAVEVITVRTSLHGHSVSNLTCCRALSGPSRSPERTSGRAIMPPPKRTSPSRSSSSTVPSPTAARLSG